MGIPDKQLNISALSFWHGFGMGVQCMKRTINIILMSMACLSASAQEAWTMERCMQYAVTHSADVQRQRIEARQTKSDYRTAALNFLPTVEAQVSGQYNWGRNIDPETNTYNNVTTFNNYYQIAASLTLFDGGQTLNAFRQARLAKANSATAMQKVQDDKAIEVMGKYVDAVYAQRSILLAREKLADSQALLHKTRRLFELGEKSRPDVAQLESQVAEDDYNLLHQQNQARQSLLALKSAMNYPSADTLCLDTTAAGLARTTEVTDDAVAIYQSFRSLSPAVKAGEFSEKSARLNWRISQGALLPRLSVGAGIATNFYKNLSQQVRVPGFGSQFSNNMGEYVYLALSIPLFTPSAWRKARRAKSDYLLAQVDLQETERRLHDDIAQAVMDRDGYAREVVQMERKTVADSLAWHMSRRKYEEGMLSTFDLHTAAQTLSDSRIRLLQMQMMLALKQKLINYYKGEPLWTLK